MKTSGKMIIKCVSFSLRKMLKLDTHSLGISSVFSHLHPMGDVSLPIWVPERKAVASWKHYDPRGVCNALSVLCFLIRAKI